MPGLRGCCWPVVVETVTAAVVAVAAVAPDPEDPATGAGSTPRAGWPLRPGGLLSPGYRNSGTWRLCRRPGLCSSAGRPSTTNRTRWTGSRTAAGPGPEAAAAAAAGSTPGRPAALAVCLGLPAAVADAPADRRAPATLQLPQRRRRPPSAVVQAARSSTCSGTSRCSPGCCTWRCGGGGGGEGGRGRAAELSCAELRRGDEEGRGRGACAAQRERRICLVLSAG